MIKLMLGTIELNPNMQIPELNTSGVVQQENRRTTSGALVVVVQKQHKGKPLQLIATEDQGWISKKARDELLAAADKVGVEHVLVAGNQSFKVMFDHSDGTAVALTPIINRLVPDESDYYTGTIKLITV
ncbi:hypothetical protein [Vibrio phage LV6]|nr:hypothetical protein [Vibrio phage LV6]